MLATSSRVPDEGRYQRLHLRDQRQPVDTGVLEPPEVRRRIGRAQLRREVRLLGRIHGRPRDGHALRDEPRAGIEALARGGNLDDQLAPVEVREQGRSVFEHAVDVARIHLRLHLPRAQLDAAFQQTGYFAAANARTLEQGRVGRHAMHHRVRQAGLQFRQVGTVEVQMEVFVHRIFASMQRIISS
jgi:hypothetical protein